MQHPLDHLPKKKKRAGSGPQIAQAYPLVVLQRRGRVAGRGNATRTSAAARNFRLGAAFLFPSPRLILLDNETAMGAAQSSPSAAQQHGLTVYSEHRVSSIVVRREPRAGHPPRSGDGADASAAIAVVNDDDDEEAAAAEEEEAQQWAGGRAYFAAAGEAHRVPVILVQKGVVNVIVTPLNGA